MPVEQWTALVEALPEIEKRLTQKGIEAPTFSKEKALGCANVNEQTKEKQEEHETDD